MLLFLQLGLGGCANADDGDAARELGQALLEFFFVVIAGALVNLDADLVNAALDAGCIAFAANDGGVVLVHDDLFAVAQVGHGGGFQLAAGLFRNDLPTGEDGDVLQHRLAAITKARGLDADDVEHTADLVQDEGGEGFAVNVLGQDEQLAAANLDHFLQQGDDIGSGRNLLVVDQDVGILNAGFHVLGVGDEVGRNITAIELHTFDVLGLELEALGFFNGDNAVFADLVHHIGDQLANDAVLGRDGSNVGNLVFGGDFDSFFADVFSNGLGGGFNATLEQHGVDASGQVLHALGDDGMRQDGGGGGAVAGDVVGLGGGFFEELGAHVFKGVFQLDFLSDGDAVVGDGGGAKLSVQGHVATLGAEGGDHRGGQDIHTVAELAAGFFSE